MSGFLLYAAALAAESGEHAGDAPLLSAEAWVAVAFFILIGLMIYLGVHKTIAAALDSRSNKIRAELDEARLLKEEAQTTLAQLRRRQRDAAKEASEILAHAKAEAAQIEKDMAEATTLLIERRSRLAEDRIRQAEASALKEVRTAAVDIATKAAQAVIATHLSSSNQNKLVDNAIAELNKKLH